MIIWGQKVGIENRPYLRRWVWDTKWGSLRLHHWFYSDDLRYPHDHDWNFYAIVLWGSVTEVTLDKDLHRHTKIRPQWSIVKFNAEYQHMIKIDHPAWTLLITGPKLRNFGYWVKGKFVKRNRYFFRFGHPDPITGKPNRRS